MLALTLSLMICTADGPAVVERILPVTPLKASEFQTPAGRPVAFKLTTDKPVTWTVATEVVHDLFVFENRCVFSSPVPGRYMIFGTAADVQAMFVVIVEGTPPNPMPPGPGPKPPEPAVDLASKIKAAFDGDKAAALVFASIYRAAAASAKDPTVQTAEQLLKAVQALSDKQGAVKLSTVRATVATEFRLLMVEIRAPLTDKNRPAVAALFETAANTLEALGAP